MKTTKLYIFGFLHQTTTAISEYVWFLCCISLVSYIKPQLTGGGFHALLVVYLWFPTSNHNGGEVPS